MSTVYFIIQQTMFFAVPLLVVSLGGLFSEKCGITNIALEGIMIFGAFAGVITINLLGGIIPGQILLLLAVFVAATVGGLYSLLHAWASIRLKADQTISGTALNLFAPAFCIFTARALFGARQVQFTDTFHITKVPLLGDIPVIGKMFFQNCYISTYIGILILIATAFIFAKTRFGMRLSACGEHPEAAASVGIPVAKMRYAGVLLSGVLGGIGGIIFVVPVSTNFDATVAGYGFLALAVLILGKWKPSKILFAAFFFGLLKALSSAYSGISFLSKLPIPSEIYKMVPYLITLSVLAASSGQSRAPKALGTVYDDGNKPTGKKKKAIIAVILAVAVAICSVSAVMFPIAEKKKNAVSNGYGAKIALLVESGTTVDDKSYMQSIWEGIIHYADESGQTRKYYQTKDNSEESLRKCAELAIKGNAECIIGASMYENTFGTLQSLYPDIMFLLFDGEPKDLKTGKVSYSPNSIAVRFAEEQAGFLAGYAAVMDGFRNLGFVGGVALPAVIRYGYGFVAGCDYAAQKLNLKQGDVNIKYNYAGTFVPNPESQAMASAWYHGGVEVIFACAGGLGNSIIKSAENANKYVIEVDQDKSEASETIITSATKDLDYALKILLTAWKDGNLTLGKNMCLSTKENCVGLPMKTSRFRTFSDEDYQKIYSEIASDKVKVAPVSTSDAPEWSQLKCVNLEFVK